MTSARFCSCGFYRKYDGAALASTPLRQNCLCLGRFDLLCKALVIDMHDRIIAVARFTADCISNDNRPKATVDHAQYGGQDDSSISSIAYAP
jgi:hypothetical protein